VLEGVPTARLALDWKLGMWIYPEKKQLVDPTADRGDHAVRQNCLSAHIRHTSPPTRYSRGLACLSSASQSLIAGELIWSQGWNWADPVASFLIAILVIFSSWKLVKESLMVLMESSLGHVDVDEVEHAMRKVDGVQDVHDLHVWTITSGMVALSAHVIRRTQCSGDHLLSRLRKLLKHRFDISHVTIQIERPEYEECRPEV